MSGVPPTAPGEADADRLLALLACDLDAGFAELVRTHQRLVYSTVLRACHQPADAEDLAAEVLLRAYRALRGYDADRVLALRLRPWLVTIALNASRNQARDRARRPLLLPLDSAPEPAEAADDIQQATDRLDQRRRLAALVAELPEQQRSAVVLRHVCGLSVAETALALDCPEGTVKSLCSRGLRRLRERVGTRSPQEALR